MSKREAILQSALQLLTHQGIHNTPMSAIAKEAGTGMGTIYNYFKNKEELINALYLHIKQEEQLVFVQFNEDEPIKTQFEKYYVKFMEFFMEHPAYFNIIEQLHASPIITEESRREGSKTVQPFYQLIQFGQQHRIIKEVPADEIMVFVGGSVFAYLRWFFKSNSTENRLENQLRLVWDAIKA